MIKTFANPVGKTFIGRLGENDHRQIVFDESREILKMYPGCVISVLHQRPSDPDAYPVNDEYITIEDGMVCWRIQSGDVAEKGNGLCEIVFIYGNTVAKTLRYHTQILDALDGNGDPPEVWRSWQQNLVETAERAEAAAELLEHPAAVAETLEPGSPATASYGNGTFTFGIPQGVQGVPGNPGTDGEDGYSPTATVNKSGKVTTVTVTDKNGTTTAQVEDGDDYVITDDNIEEIGNMVVNSETVQETVEEMHEIVYGTDKDGNPLPSTNPHSGNNAKYWALLAQAAAGDAQALLIKEQLVDEIVPDTVQTIAFDQVGNVQSITHSNGGTAVRTDVYTFGTETITEVRTLTTGQSLTIVTNTTTLATTITYDDGQAA